MGSEPLDKRGRRIEIGCAVYVKHGGMKLKGTCIGLVKTKAYAPGSWAAHIQLRSTDIVILANECEVLV